MIRLESEAQEGKVSLHIPCRWCRKMWTIRGVRKEAFDRWRAGELIQRALPELSANERELLISGTCEVCWDDMFKGGEDEE